MVSAIVLAAALVALRAAQVASAGVVHDVASLRDVLVAVGDGERQPRAHAAAATELAELADAANAMVGQLVEEDGVERPPTLRGATSSPPSLTTCARP